MSTLAVYKVVAPLVLVKDEAGRITYAYEGALVRLLDYQAEQFLAENLVEESLLAANLVEESEVELDDSDAAANGLVKPPTNAAKPVLVDWVVANVVKDDGTEYTEAEADDLTKPQLWDIINSIED